MPCDVRMNSINYLKYLARPHPIISAEVDAAVKQHLPTCGEWTKIYIMSKLVNIVTSASVRILLHYRISIMDDDQQLKIGAPNVPAIFSPSSTGSSRRQEKGQRVIEYVRPMGKEWKNSLNWRQLDCVIYWLLNCSGEYGTHSVGWLAYVQLGLSFAAINTTSLVVRNKMYTLVVAPEHPDLPNEEMILVLLLQLKRSSLWVWTSYVPRALPCRE